MNLPHQEPLIFAQDILVQKDNYSEVLCKFNTIPTLAMFIEAAAQASSTFSNSNEPKVGFLTTAKNVKLINTPEHKEFIFKLNMIIDLGNMKQFSFEAYANENCYAEGTFTIVVKD